MASAAERRRKYASDTDGNAYATGGNEPYKLSRAAQRELYGSRAIVDRGQSPRDTMVQPKIGLGDAEGRKEWASFFAPSRRSLPSLMPEAPGDAKALAGAAEETGVLTPPRMGGFAARMPNATPQVMDWNSPTMATQIGQQVAKSHEQWFDSLGMSRPTPSITQPVQPGQGFVSKYGYGKLTNAIDNYQRRLSRLASPPSIL